MLLMRWPWSSSIEDTQLLQRPGWPGPVRKAPTGRGAVQQAVHTSPSTGRGGHREACTGMWERVRGRAALIGCVHLPRALRRCLVGKVCAGPLQEGTCRTRSGPSWRGPGAVQAG